MPLPKAFALTQQHLLITAWTATGATLVLAMAALGVASPRFGYGFAVFEMPVLPMVAGLVAMGLAFLLVPLLIPRLLRSAASCSRLLLAITLGTGLAMRLVLLQSEPVLEDDYQRYLWDGAMTAAGFNPYSTAPAAALGARSEDSPLAQLARQAGQTLERVNHPGLRTIYPPTAQLGFAAAHWLGPFSLTAWRLFCLVMELAGLGLLLALLRETGRSSLWSALYWWNPLAAKELVNSAHMEALLIPLLLGTVLLVLRGHSFRAIFLAMAAAGAKLWPVLWLPLVLRPLWHRRTKLALAVALVCVLAALMAWPVLSAGLDRSSGFVAYAERWKTNAALFPLWEDAVRFALAPFLSATAPQSLPALAARLAIVLGLGLFALWLARPAQAPTQQEPIDRARPFFLLAAAVFLLSPAQFPWYYLWVLPFLPLFPWRGLLLLTALLPLYYAGFHLMVMGQMASHGPWLVWLIWLPCWIILALERTRWGPIASPPPHPAKTEPAKTGAAPS